MGCDVHPAIEVREDPKDNWWTFVAVPDRNRNYELFGMLADVRGEVPDGHVPIAKGRGIPEGVDYHTYNVENDCVVSGDHSPSWFTLAEAKEYNASWLQWERTREQWDRWVKTGEFFRGLYNVTDDDVRFVFNFDS